MSTFGVERPTRRPTLNSVRQIDSIRDLMPFFSSVSISSYESVYASGGNVDWAAVEKLHTSRPVVREPIFYSSPGYSSASYLQHIVSVLLPAGRLVRIKPC
ncbi:hypothetical protein C8F01DRAFT_1193222, partial [Mycena amicta]